VKKLPAAEGSQLLLVSIENASHEDPKKAVAEVEAAGIDHIDIVVSNAGISPANAPLDAADPQIILDAFNVNALSSIVLFQAVNPLLLKSSAPKWISVSSRAGSIDTAEGWYYWIGAYGVSKAAQNWFTKYVLHSCKHKFNMTLLTR
jgi:NAD(P)-dependent dehydrogenase (short-subunit alcohol dehydrogenase family)